MGETPAIITSARPKSARLPVIIGRSWSGLSLDQGRQGEVWTTRSARSGAAWRRCDPPPRPAYARGVDSQLVKIKRLVARGHYAFTMKADLECAADGLTRGDVTESILTAQFLRIKNSRSPWRRGRREKLYIQGLSIFANSQAASQPTARAVGTRPAPTSPQFSRRRRRRENWGAKVDRA